MFREFFNVIGGPNHNMWGEPPSLLRIIFLLIDTFQIIIMENHSDDIIRRVVIIFTEIAAFILWEVLCYEKYW